MPAFAIFIYLVYVIVCIYRSGQGVAFENVTAIKIFVITFVTTSRYFVGINLQVINFCKDPKARRFMFCLYTIMFIMYTILSPQKVSNYENFTSS